MFFHYVAIQTEKLDYVSLCAGMCVGAMEGGGGQQRSVEVTYSCKPPGGRYEKLAQTLDEQ